ncbi:MAG: hypothetical protein AB7N76_27530 [Planctomycetota bacterium]
MRALLPAFLVLLVAGPALGYGYTREEDPLLKAFQAAVRAAREGDFGAVRAQAAKVGWQLDELKTKEDLGVDYRPVLDQALADPTTEARVVTAWANLMYLALLQKLHWNGAEKLADYHKARARLDAAWAYYELALAGNVRQDDAARRKKDPKAPSRHEDLVKTFEVARKALGTPGLLGAGKRPPDPAAFRKASLRIAGHLNAVFMGFVKPGAKER